MSTNDFPSSLLDSLRQAWDSSPPSPEPDLRTILDPVPASNEELCDVLRIDALERRRRNFAWRLDDHYVAVLPGITGPGSIAARTLIRLELGFGGVPATAVRKRLSLLDPAYTSDVDAVAAESVTRPPDPSWIPPSDAEGDADSDRAKDDIINGQYRLVRRIDLPVASGGPRGSFGEVWEASQIITLRPAASGSEAGTAGERKDPEKRTTRNLAIKFIRRDRIDPIVLRRFTEIEPKALARLSHPYIARFHELGFHGADPFLVMEYVRGSSLTEYADAKQLSIDDRIRLIVKICDAMQHVHAEGLIHRDIKPANILVAEIEAKKGDSAIPKLIDFGLAKASGSEPLASQFPSEQGFAGTRPYASPEQFARYAHERLKRTVDVYGLAAVLFDLLVGVSPMQHVFEDPSLSPLERDNKCAGETRPWLVQAFDRLSPDRQARIARDRGLGVAALRRALRGAIRLIVAAALEVEPDRRLQEVTQLREDLENYLQGLPLRYVRREPVWSRAIRRVRRNPLPFTLAASAFLALGAGLGLALWQWDIAAKAKQVAAQKAQEASEAKVSAEQKAKEAQKAEEFAVEQLKLKSDAFALLRRALSMASPREGNRADLTIREILLDAGNAIIKDESVPVDNKLDLVQLVGDILTQLRERDSAAKMFDWAVRRVDERLESLPESASERRDLELRKASLQESSAFAAPDHSSMRERMGEAHTIFAKHLGPSHERTVTAGTSAAAVAGSAGAQESADAKWQAKEPVWLKAAAPVFGMTPEAFQILVRDRLDRAGSEVAQGRRSEAVDILLADPVRKKLESDQLLPNIALVLLELAAREWDYGLLDSSEACARAAIVVASRLPERHEYRGQILAAAARMLVRRGQFAEARTLMEDAWRRSLAIRGKGESLPLYLILMQITALCGDCEGVTRLGAALQDATPDGDNGWRRMARKGYIDALLCALRSETGLPLGDVDRAEALIAVIADYRPDEESSNPLNTVYPPGWPRVEDAMRALLDAGCSAERPYDDEYRRYPVHFAAASQSVVPLQVLAERKVDLSRPDRNGWRPLVYAVWKGQLENMRFLIGQGVSVNVASDTGDTPLHAAATVAQAEAADLLLQRGAEVDARNHAGETPLVSVGRSVQGRDAVTGVIRVLLAGRADLAAVDTDGWTALHWASNKPDRVEVAEALLQTGADPNRGAVDGRTPLHLAAASGAPKTVKALLDGGANINALDSDRNTPLVMAIRSPNKDGGPIAAAEALIAGKADLTVQDGNGWTALHWAANLDEKGTILKFLLEAGADPNARAKDQSTPLHALAMSSAALLENAQALLDRGADPRLMDADDLRPVDLRSDTKSEIARLLEPKKQ